MKKPLVLSLTLGFLMSLALFSQQIFVEESLVINIEVPIRVFDGNTFVDNLTIDDFEVYEDGVLQKIDAVYLINKRTVERSEEKKRFSPDTSRSFFIFFEVSQYTARLGEALEYLGNEVILPGDELIVVTPIKSYKLRDKALEVTSREDLIDQLKGIVRKDCLEGDSEYRNTVLDLASLARAISASMKSGTIDAGPDREAVEATELDSLSGGASSYAGLELDEQLMLYQGLLQKLEVLRQVEQMKLMDFARLLRTREGQKNVFLFYQKEFIPQVEPQILNAYMSQFQVRPDLVQTIMEVMNFNFRDITFDVDLVKQAYADSSIAIHFLFVSTPPMRLPGVRLEERSGDIYGAFSQMARATGGYIDSSANPAALFRSAVESSENYYLLYYTPKTYLEGERIFRNIDVKVKGKNYRILHRAGYYTD
ncbi:MAG: hypothetical protein PVI11_04085 [Candidatus Aminicenantes bacterium]|jgi:hypothetical protein